MKVYKVVYDFNNNADREIYSDFYGAHNQKTVARYMSNMGCRLIACYPLTTLELQKFDGDFQTIKEV